MQPYGGGGLVLCLRLGLGLVLTLALVVHTSGAEAESGLGLDLGPLLRAVVVDTVVPEAQEFLPGGGRGTGYLYLGYAAEDHCVLPLSGLQAGVRVTGCGPHAKWGPYAQVGTMRYFAYGPCAPAARDVALDLDAGAVACHGQYLWPVHVTDLQPWA